MENKEKTVSLQVSLNDLETLASVRECQALDYLLRKPGVTELITPESPILINAIDSGCSFETFKFLLETKAGRDIPSKNGRTVNDFLKGCDLSDERSRSVVRLFLAAKRLDW
ncbi:MAG: hypothetical protein V1851_01880 [Patescibacteria group bacterium]